MKAIENLDSLIVVFSLGLEGAFSYHSDMLGWTPKYFDENKLFLKKIIASLEKIMGLIRQTYLQVVFQMGLIF